MSKPVSALAQWYGSARMITPQVAEACKGCEVAYIPFSGGMCEVPVIPARTVVVNDLHRHLINLARVVTDPCLKPDLVHQLEMTPFHPDELAACQKTCLAYEQFGEPHTGTGLVDWAAAYFVCVWMTRAGSAGTPAEFTGQLSLRWEAGGGDSNRRFRSAVEAIDDFHAAMVDRCTFSTLDCFEFFEKCKDQEGHVVYSDPPFFGPGEKYTHSPPKREAEGWHRALADAHHRFCRARVVIRAYDVPLMRECYREPDWTWNRFKGRKQTNDSAPEVLIVR